MKVCWCYILCLQPVNFLFVLTGFSIAFTDRDAALVIAVCAGLLVPGKRMVVSRSASLLLLFGLWALLRGAAAVAEHGKHGVFVDMHGIPYLLVLPGMFRYGQEAGWKSVCRFLFRVAYLSGAVGLLLYCCNLAHLFHNNMSNALAVTQVSPDLARPGGEVLLPFAIVASPLRHAISSRREFRYGSLVLGGALICSQTLTFAVASLAGLAFYLVLAAARAPHGRHYLGRIVRWMVLAGVLMAGIGIAYPSSYHSLTRRFNVGARVDTDSVLYREVQQKATIDEWLHRSLETAFLGAGPGSQVVFVFNGVDVVTNDTHDSLLTIGLKNGVVGELLYAGVLFTLVLEFARFDEPVIGVSLAAGVVATVVMTVTAPLLTYPSGWAFLAFLVAISRLQALESWEPPPSQRSRP
jgi:hypothetical protein